MALNKATKCGIVFLCLATIGAIICGIVFGLKYAYPDVEESGLKFEPHGSESSNLIRYEFTNADSVRYYTDKIDEFLLPYKIQSRENIDICDFDHYPHNGSFCEFDIKSLHSCSSENYYGNNRLSPCVFLTLKKINNWNPIFYNDISALPEEMPVSLKNHIMSEAPQRRNSVWVSCAGENDYDKENIGPVMYFPHFGFPGYYFPYTNVDGYISPIVAIKFERPRIGVVITVECKLWAHNINNNSTEGSGYARFSLLIDL